MNMLALRRANVARQKEWDSSDAKTDIAFWGVELAGDVGEACNIIKKHPVVSMQLGGWSE